MRNCYAPPAEVIDTTAIPLGDIDLPEDPGPGGLDGVADRLEGAAEAPCEHPNDKLKTDASGNIACTFCGEVVAKDEPPPAAATTTDPPPPALGGEPPRTGRKPVRD